MFITRAIASAADIRAGISTAKVVTPAAMLAALGFSCSWTSGELSIPADGALLDVVHGLGVKATAVEVWAVNKETESNFLVGDLTKPTDGDGNSSFNNGIGITIPNATNVEIRMGSSNGFRLMNRGTGVIFNGTAVKWKFIVKVKG